MKHLHHDHAKALLERHALHVESSDVRRAQTRMWVMVGSCAAAFVGMYALIAPGLYDMPAVKQSFVEAATGVQELTDRVVPEIEKTKVLWSGMQSELQKQANEQVKQNLVEEMKQQLEYGRSEESN